MVFMLFAIASIVGCGMAFAGTSGLYVTLALAIWLVFLAAARQFPTFIISLAIILLAAFPFSFGLQSGVLPKLFGDECVLVAYTASMPLLYLFAKRTWQPGFSWLYFILAIFAISQAFSLAVATDLVAMRNLLETFVFGPVLMVVCVQEAANNVHEEHIANTVLWTTLLIAILSVAERVLQRNPIMEHSADILYLSPQLARITEGVYRPYVTFFHPSEAGTFMAMGVPFAIRYWQRRHSVLSSFALCIVTTGLIVNATRGVWVGLAVAIVLLTRNAWKLIVALAPVAILVGTIAYLTFSDRPFMQRLIDLNNLYSRFVFWDLALRIFGSHFILGVGHMQFKNVYLYYVRGLSNLAHFDISKVSVTDNLYLTTIVEHGFVGISTLVIVFTLILAFLKRVFDRLYQADLLGAASFVRATAMSAVTYAAAGLFADVNQFTKASKFLFILLGLGIGVGSRYLPVRGTQESLAVTAKDSQEALA